MAILPEADFILTKSCRQAKAPLGVIQVLSDRLHGDMGETPMPRLPAVAGGTGVPPVILSVYSIADLRPAPPRPR